MAPAFAIGTLLGITFVVVLNPLLGTLIGVAVAGLFLKMSYIEIEEDEEMFV